MRHRVAPRLTGNARDLRNRPTDAERLIWQRISRYRPRFTRQLPIGPYIVDLACRPAKLAIEFDGSQHAEHMAEDARRTADLEEAGWTVIRLWNSDVLSNPEGAVEHILRRAAECLGGTHPQPLPSREGRKRS
jgi:very-short-patch-repair endonuclease